MFKINYLTYLLMLISLFSGKFKNIIVFMLLIIIHECGHFFTAKLFNWKIDKIYIYPLGGITKFNDTINKPFIEELLVAVAGPIFQIISAKYLVKIDVNATIYSNTLLMFNLLPISILDGGKILNIILSKFIPYKKSLSILMKVSFVVYYIFLFFIIKIEKNIFFLLVFFLLFFKISEDAKKKNYYFNKFILERYIYNYNYKKNKIIKDIGDSYKYKRNMLLINNNLFNIKEYIDHVNNKM